jgi:hypothetical protein
MLAAFQTENGSKSWRFTGRSSGSKVVGKNEGVKPVARSFSIA